MADIDAALVKELRLATNVSMMECKRALVETGGDMAKATRLLREKGIAVAAKKATRTAKQGLIASSVSSNGKAASLVEVNCETDFVARNKDFVSFVAQIADLALETDAPLADQVKDTVTAKITEIGENIIVRRNTRFVLQGNGVVASYIHLGGKVGVLVELCCENEETASSPVFLDLAKDLTLHVAACSPAHLAAKDVPEDVIKAERSIFEGQVKDKPPAIMTKIVDGKIQKFFEEVCLLDQGFVKEPKQQIKHLLSEISKEMSDSITIGRYARYQLGE